MPDKAIKIHRGMKLESPTFAQRNPALFFTTTSFYSNETIHDNAVSIAIIMSTCDYLFYHLVAVKAY